MKIINTLFFILLLPIYIFTQNIIDINPSSGMQGTTLSVSVSGQNTNFVQATSIWNVWFSQGSSTVFYPKNIKVQSNTQLDLELNLSYSYPIGFYDLNIYDSNDYIVKSNAFIIQPNPNPPSLKTINPNAGHKGQTLSVNISGQYTHFTQATNTYNLWFEQGSSTIVYPSNISPVNDNEIEAEFILNNYIPLGYYDVKYFTEIDGQLNLPNSFLVTPNPNPPAIIAVNPDNANKGSALKVSISGQNTNFMQATSIYNLWFEQGSSTIVYPSNISPVNNNEIEAEFILNNNIPLGYYDVKYFTEIDGQLNLPNSFLVTPNPNPPAIIAVNPDNANKGSALKVTISGQNTNFMQATSIYNLWFNQNYSSYIYPKTVNVINNNTLEAEFQFSNLINEGFYNINYNNDIDGQLVLENGFYINSNPNPPSFVSIDPSYTMINQTVTIKIITLNTHFTYPESYLGIKLFKNDISIYPYSFNIISDTEIDASFIISESYEPGFYNLNIFSYYDGNITINDVFNIKPCNYSTPDKAFKPVGNEHLCKNSPNSVYYTKKLKNTEDYYWSVYPQWAVAEANSVYISDTTITINWNDDYSGFVKLSVAGHNNCIKGEYSDSLTINIGPSAEFYYTHINDTTLQFFPLSNYPGISYQWDFGDGTTDTTASPVHNFTDFGFYNVSLSVKKDDCYDNFSQDLALYYVSVNKNIINTVVNIYPNPSKGFITLNFKDFNGKLTDFEIYNTTGQLVYHKKQIIRENHINIDLTGFNKGIYFIKINTPNFTKTQKLLLY